MRLMHGKSSAKAVQESTERKNVKKKSSGSLFGKISSTLSSKSTKRSISEYSIELDDPHRHYGCGELVQGTVNVTVEKDVKITHLVVNLKGYVELLDNPTTAAGKKGKDVGIRLADNTSELCRDEQVLCGEGTLAPGVYKFQFVMVLPGKGLPSSLKFEKGKIEYVVSATLTRPVATSPIMSCSKKVLVRETIDLAPLKPIPAKTLSYEFSRKKVKTGAEDAKSVASYRNSSTDPLFRPCSPPLPPSPAHGNATKAKVATARVQILKPGFLPGGQIPIHIQISHVSPVRTTCGVIATLYRSCQFDVLSMTPQTFNGKDSAKKEPIYSASSGFRKELDQVMLPMMIDHHTLRCDLNATLRVPEDAFPTIKSVPLGVVSFKYYVEVVVDFGGKIANKDVLFVPVDTSLRRALPTVDPEDPTPRPPVSALVQGIIRTEDIRRQKHVKSTKFEITVGTTDSSIKGKSKAKSITISQETIPEEPSYEEYVESEQMVMITPQWEGENIEQYSPIPSYEISLPAQEDEPVDEKERIRFYEQRLLPSAPPIAASEYEEPSAPPLHVAPTNSYLAATAPVYEDDIALAGPSSSESAQSSYPCEDKQELERQRLMQEASEAPLAAPSYAPSAPAPDAWDDGHYHGEYAPSAPPLISDYAPSAPILPDSDQQLPAYTR